MTQTFLYLALKHATADDLGVGPALLAILNSGTANPKYAKLLAEDFVAAPNNIARVQILEGAEIGFATESPLAVARKIFTYLVDEVGIQLSTTAPSAPAAGPIQVTLNNPKNASGLTFVELAREFLAGCHNIGTQITSETIEGLIERASGVFGSAPVFAFDHAANKYDVDATIRFIKRAGQQVRMSRLTTFERFALHTTSKAGGEEKFKDMVNIFNPGGPVFVSGYFEGENLAVLSAEMLQCVLWWTQTQGSPITSETDQWNIIEMIRVVEWKAPWINRSAVFKTALQDDEDLSDRLKLWVKKRAVNFNEPIPALSPAVVGNAGFGASQLEGLLTREYIAIVPTEGVAALTKAREILMALTGDGVYTAESAYELLVRNWKYAGVDINLALSNYKSANNAFVDNQISYKEFSGFQTQFLNALKGVANDIRIPVSKVDSGTNKAEAIKLLLDCLRKPAKDQYQIVRDWPYDTLYVLSVAISNFANAATRNRTGGISYQEFSIFEANFSNAILDAYNELTQ